MTRSNYWFREPRDLTEDDRLEYEEEHALDGTDREEAADYFDSLARREEAREHLAPVRTRCGWTDEYQSEAERESAKGAF